MGKEKTEKEIDIESLDAELAAARTIEENKNTAWGKITAVFAFCMSVFHILTVYRPLGVIPQRGIHTAFAFTILFLSMPLYDHFAKGKLKNNTGFRTFSRVFDVICVIAFWVAIYLCNDEYNHLADHLGIPTVKAAIAGAILLILVLEGTRRCLGNIMPILASLFVLYALLGKYIPGRLGHRGYSLTQIFKYLAVDLDGIFGTTISVSAGTIFLFVMFGAFLEASGCSEFINNLALSITGKLRCGPALAAVVASALMGCINGSAVANVVGTGTFTIPLMKSRGYKSEFASGVEAVASTGGQILPPVMGSGAFLMVVFTLVPYNQIVVAAVVPAVLYFLGAGIAVYAQGEIGDVELLPEDQIPKTRDVMKDGWLYLIVIAVLVWALLIAMLSPARSALYACIAVPVVMAFDKRKRFPLKKIPEALIKSGYSALSRRSDRPCAREGPCALRHEAGGLQEALCAALRLRALSGKGSVRKGNSEKEIRTGNCVIFHKTAQFFFTFWQGESEHGNSLQSEKSMIYCPIEIAIVGAGGMRLFPRRRRTQNKDIF